MDTFVALGFGFQLALLVNFILRWAKPQLEQRWSKTIYGAFVLAAVVGGVLMWTETGLTKELSGPGLMLAWALFGFVVDGVLRIDWRSPPRYAVLVPYVTLYTVALFGFWMPILQQDKTLGLAFGVLLAAHTALNIGSHFRKKRASDLAR